MKKFEANYEITTIPDPEKEIKPVELTDEDAKELKKINTRWTQMHATRPVEIANGALTNYEKQWSAEWVPSKDGTSNVKLPLVRQVVETKMSEELSRPPQFRLRAENNKSQLRQDATQKTFDFLQVRDNWNEAIDQSYLLSNIYGTSVDMPEVVYEPIVKRTLTVDENGNRKQEVETYYNTRFRIRSLPLQSVWIDDRAYGILEDAIDCIIEDEIDKDAFILQAKAANKATGKEIYYNLDQLRGGSTDKEFTQGEPRELKTNAKDNPNLLKRRHYFNKLKDQYTVIINKSVIVRSGPSPYKNGMLPTAFNISHKNPLSLYGAGIAYLLQNNQAEQNTFRDMLYDGIHGWAYPKVFISGSMSFDGEDMNSSSGQFITYEGQFAVNSVSVQPATDALIGVTNILNQDIPAAVGVDPRAILSGPEETARRTKQRDDIKNKRIKKQTDYRNYYLKRIMTLMLDLVLKHFPVEDALRIDDTVGFPMIPFENQKVNIPTGNNRKKVNRKPQDYIEFIEAKGSRGLFEAKPDFIRGDFDIFPVNDSTMPVSEQVEQETMRLMVSDLVNIRTLENTIVGEHLNLRSVIDNTLKTYGKDPDLFKKQTEQGVDPAVGESISRVPKPTQPPQPGVEDMKQALIAGNV